MSHPTHKTRYSDSSLYDEVCTLCGATDYNGTEALNRPCPKTKSIGVVHPLMIPRVAWALGKYREALGYWLCVLIDAGHSFEDWWDARPWD